MRSNQIVLGLLVCFAGIASSNVLYQGTVKDPFGFPIPGATVVYNASCTTSTDTNGEFYLDCPVGVRHSLARSAYANQLSIHGWQVAFSAPNNASIRFNAITASGRIVFSKLIAASNGSAALNLQRESQWPSGMYILQIIGPEDRMTVPFLVQSGMVNVQQSSIAMRTTSQAQALGKVQAITMFTASAPGFQTSVGYLNEYADIGLELTLYYPGQTIPQPVRYVDSTDGYQFNYNPYYTTTVNTWCNSAVKSYEKVVQTRTKNDSTITKFYSFPLVKFDNGIAEIHTAPSLGSRVLRVIDKTKGSARSLFVGPRGSGSFEGGKFQNVGGLKPAYPYCENSTGAIDPIGGMGYKAGFFVQLQPNGAASVIMNMRFDYNQREEDMSFLGKYGDRPLISVVTLRPGSNALDIRYISDNVNPTQRSDRMWNDAIWPDGVGANGTITGWVFPTKYAIQHLARAVSGDPALPWDIQSLAPLIPDYNHGTVNNWSKTSSYFALYPQYGFVGPYYTGLSGGGNACHLRVADPTKVPGMKLYNAIKIPETWSGTNVLFEAPHAFKDAFEPNYMPLNYYLTKNVGKVAYANENVAIVTPTATTFNLCSSRQGIVTIYNYNQSTNPIFSNRYVGPDSVISGTFSGGLRVVSVVDNKELCNIHLPLSDNYIDNSSTLNEVKAMADKSGGDGSIAPANLDARYQYNYELEDPVMRENGLNAMASIIAATHLTSADNSSVLASIARAAYKCGGFSAVNTILNLLGTNNQPEADYLRFLMAYELKMPVDTFINKSMPIEANYLKALYQISKSNVGAARVLLDELLTSRPQAIRPRILRMYLTNSIPDAVEVYKRVPGSLELWTALADMATPLQSIAVARLNGTLASKQDGLLAQNQMAAIRSADFLKEIKTGAWRHERRYEYDYTWFEGITMPAFPDTLKYKDGPGPLQLP